MKNIRYMITGLIVILLISICANSFCAVAVSKKVYNSANVTYLHSNGETPSADEEYSDGTPVVLPIVSNLTQAKGVTDPVDNVFGLKATLSDTKVIISWNPVTRYNNATLDTFNETFTLPRVKYVVYYSSSTGSGYQSFPGMPLGGFDSQTLSCTHITGVNSPTYFYTIVCVDDMDNTSGYSPDVDKSGNRYVHRTDAATTGDTYTRLYVPGNVASALYQGGAGNIYNDYIHIEATRVSGDEGKSKPVGSVQGLVAASISFDAYKYTNREKITTFIFPENVKITIKYEIENGLVKNTTLRANQVKDKLGFYYFNGLEWVKLPAELDATKQTLTATVNHLSKYALISGATNATKLTLSKRIPPIFTPNGDGINDYVFFTFENPSTDVATIKLKIFDLSGSLVKEISGTDQGVPSLGGTMKWDGKDSTGSVMESGIYIYQIQAGSEFISGSVVLAK